MTHDFPLGQSGEDRFSIPLNTLLPTKLESEAEPRKAWEGSGTRQLHDNADRAALERHLDYKAPGDFNSQVERLLEYFPPQKVFIAWMEDWKNDPDWLYRELATFLGIDGSHPLTFDVHNRAKRHRNAILSRMTIRPPAWVIVLPRGLKRLLGRERLGIATKLRKVRLETRLVP